MSTLKLLLLLLSSVSKSAICKTKLSSGVFGFLYLAHYTNKLKINVFIKKYINFYLSLTKVRISFVFFSRFQAPLKSSNKAIYFRYNSRQIGLTFASKKKRPLPPAAEVPNVLKT